jgi:hypothetical protein
MDDDVDEINRNLSPCLNILMSASRKSKKRAAKRAKASAKAAGKRIVQPSYSLPARAVPFLVSQTPSILVNAESTKHSMKKV